MVAEEVRLMLRYDVFARLWKVLVSRRKARKLDIDRNQAWEQLLANGDAAQFLYGSTRGIAAADSEPLADAQPRKQKRPTANASPQQATGGPRTKRPAAARVKNAAARKPGAKRVAKKPSSSAVPGNRRRRATTK